MSSSSSSSSFAEYIASISSLSSPSSSLPSSPSPKRVAVFGVSGNPPHTGHQAIATYLTSSSSSSSSSSSGGGGAFDSIWIVPVYKHIYSSKQGLASYDDRLMMCKLCFEQCSTSSCMVRVLDIERECSQYLEADAASKGSSEPIRVGTVDVLNYIKARTSHVDIDLHLVLSSETYNDLVTGKWKLSQEVVNMVTLQVISREGFKLTDSPTVHNIRKTFHSHVPMGVSGVSSTAIRDYDLSILEFFGVYTRRDLDPKVFAFIRRRGLYFFEHEKTTTRTRTLSLLAISLASFGITLLLSRRGLH